MTTYIAMLLALITMRLADFAVTSLVKLIAMKMLARKLNKIISNNNPLGA